MFSASAYPQGRVDRPKNGPDPVPVNGYIVQVNFSDQPPGASPRFLREKPGASALRLICGTRTFEMDRTLVPTIRYPVRRTQ